MVTVFFGGRSCEHDISILTGLQTLSACRKSAVGVYIDGDGVWYTSDGFDSLNAVRNKKFKGKRVYLRPGEPYLYSKNKRLFKIDAAVLCMHGMLGEDGCLQGLLEMNGIPYTGSGVLASAIGMNKVYAKRIFERAELPVLPYGVVTRDGYNTDPYAAVKPLLDKLGFPIIVKPCNLGSSIGISVSNNLNELYAAFRLAFEWDDTVIAEKALSDFTEVNCAVLKTVDDLIVSDTEQPVGWKEFLTFSDKYSGDVKSTRHKIPAEIDAETEELIKTFAVQAFTSVGCSGVARVDFLVKDGQVYINEINTIPGSLAYPLFRQKMDFSKLIDCLIEDGVERKRRFERLRHTYTPIDPLLSKS